MASRHRADCEVNEGPPAWVWTEHGNAEGAMRQSPREVRKRPSPPHHGTDLIKALDFAVRNGFRVENKRRTGERLLRHPSTPRAVLFNSRRKDATRAVVRFIRKHYT
jgi:hypothetical protein